MGDVNRIFTAQAENAKYYGNQVKELKYLLLIKKTSKFKVKEIP